MVLTDTKSGDGVEVWATLSDEVMAVLEHDEELLAFASLNPSILSDKLIVVCDKMNMHIFELVMSPFLEVVFFFFLVKDLHVYFFPVNLISL